MFESIGKFFSGLSKLMTAWDSSCGVVATTATKSEKLVEAYMDIYYEDLQQDLKTRQKERKKAQPKNDK